MLGYKMLILSHVNVTRSSSGQEAVTMNNGTIGTWIAISLWASVHTTWPCLSSISQSDPVSTNFSYALALPTF